MSDLRKLSEQQEQFCEYYVSRPVGAEAARFAGYEPKSSAVQASRLLGQPHIRERIAAMRTDIAAQHCQDTDTILAKLESVFALAVQDHHWQAAARALSLQAQITGILPGAGRGAGPITAPKSAEKAQPAAVAQMIMNDND